MRGKEERICIRICMPISIVVIIIISVIICNHRKYSGSCQKLYQNRGPGRRIKEIIRKKLPNEQCAVRKDREIVLFERRRQTTNLATGVLLCLLIRAVTLVFWRSFEDIKEHGLTWPHLKDASRVAASIAVIRRRPDRREVFVEQGCVALHTELMCTQNM
jgi:hypothetical protein